MAMLAPPVGKLPLDPVAVSWVASDEIGNHLLDSSDGDVPGDFIVLEKPIGVLNCSRDEAREVWIDRHVDTSLNANHWRAGHVATNGCWPPKSIAQINAEKAPLAIYRRGQAFRMRLSS